MLVYFSGNPLGGPFGPMPHTRSVPSIEENMVEIKLELNPIKHFTCASKDQLQNHLISVNEKISLCFDKFDKLKGEYDIEEISTSEGPHNWNPFPYPPPQICCIAYLRST
jgi:hypothetical protein